MTRHVSYGDSSDTHIVIVDESSLPKVSLGPIPPKLKELHDWEREMLRKYGKWPEQPSPPKADSPEPPAAQS